MPYVHNPISRGFYPDPSICRAGDTYYRVHSTFAYAPGIPIFESKDLISWQQIGNVLDRPSQMLLDHAGVSKGIYAPTIRWHKGVFYVIVTNVGVQGQIGDNFYVTAEDPAGPWSDPIFLEGAQGIDPSLYFEGEKAWYIGQRQKADAKYFGDCEIWLQELDLHNGKLRGEVYVLWDGAMQHTWWPEGPHIYKKDDWYYLLIAEGGTEYNHSISIARSRELTGPYEGCPSNPVFTHRHLGRQYPVQCAGHGDLIETPEGDWYILMLSVRMQNGEDPMGRESFLADVTWEEDWPVINAGEGRLREVQAVQTTASETAAAESGAAPREAESPDRTEEIRWTKRPDFRLLGLKRNLLTDCDLNGRMLTKIDEEHDQLQVSLQNNLRDPEAVPELFAVRLEEPEFSLSCRIDAAYIEENGEAGLIWFYDESNFVTYSLRKENSAGYSAVCTVCVHGSPRENLILTAAGSETDLCMKRTGTDLLLLLNAETAGRIPEVTGLCSQKAGGFTGGVIGVYGSSRNRAEAGSVTFGRMTVTYKNVR